MRCACICESSESDRYKDKAQLALSLTKADFVINGYPVDETKYPLKPPRGKGKGKRRVDDDGDEEEEEDENPPMEFERLDLPIAVQPDPASRGDSDCADVGGFYVEGYEDPALRRGNSFADGAGPSNVRSQSRADSSDETSDDGIEVLAFAPSPLRKRQRTPAQSNSPAMSSSPPTAQADMALKVEMLLKKVEEQERLTQETLRRQELRQEELLAAQRADMERNTQAMLATMFARFEQMLPAQPIPIGRSSGGNSAELASGAPFTRSAVVERLPSPRPMSPEQSSLRSGQGRSPAQQASASVGADPVLSIAPLEEPIIEIPVDEPHVADEVLTPTTVGATPEYSSGGIQDEE